MRTLAFVLCLGGAVAAACAPAGSPSASAGGGALSNADQQTLKGAGASGAPSAEPVAAPEASPVVARLYREGHELAVVQAVGLFAFLVVVLSLLAFGVPRPFRRRAVDVPARRDERRQSRAA